MLGQKGGSGKTTIAVHIAVAAQDDGEGVGIIDTDPQASARSWINLREAKEPPVIAVAPAEIGRVLGATSGGSLIVIDTPPHAALGAYNVASLADLILMPLRPTMFDLETLEAVASIAKAAQRPAAFILNQCHPQGNEAASAREALESYGYPVFPSNIGLRKAYARATNIGQAVTEFDPKGLAAEEMRGLWQWAKGMLSRNLEFTHS